MFSLVDGRNELYQWDIDRQVIVSDATVTEVHFCNRTDDCSLVVEVKDDNGLRVANIPNILLQDNWNIRVYAYCSNYTKVEETFKVKARTKPSDYVYTETEVLNYQTLLDRMNTIDENISQAVEDYLTNNPIEGGATTEQVEQINKNTEDITALKTEIDNLPTKKYVDDAVKNVEVDLTGYATEKYVDDKVSNIKVDADLEGYATENWVLNKGYISNIPSEYITEDELNSKGYATNSQLSAYAKKSDIPSVPTKVSELENDKKYLTGSALTDYAKKSDIPSVPTKVSEFENDAGYLTEHQDLSDYAKKSDIPKVDLSDYYTKEETDTAINNSKDSYYIDFTNATTTKQDATEEMIEMATRFLAGENLCVHIKDSSHTSYRTALIAKENTNKVGIIHSGIIVGDVYNNTPSDYTSYYVEYIPLSQRWAYSANPSSITFATKEYVDSLFEGIATAEGGSY